ncbi:hypothetical protein OHA71_06445 [Streptomyces sp. NBC_00444]|uniref:hypothetical protein n=1 Tax=Streptomyces sp. NBC_00444 TaxID=2975744 RepID=UPI002E2294E9
MTADDVLQEARDRLYTAIEECGSYEDPRDIHDLIDDYTHALADKQRAAAKAEYDRDVHIDDLSMRFMTQVIDLIDPAKGSPR